MKRYDTKAFTEAESATVDNLLDWVNGRISFDDYEANNVALEAEAERIRWMQDDDTAVQPSVAPVAEIIEPVVVEVASMPLGAFTPDMDLFPL